jgi:uncharacterized protein
MKPSFLDKLCCPLDKHELRLQIFAQHESGDITEGLLTCPACGRYYPIVYGIPIMTPDEYRERALEEPILKKWGRQLEQSEEQRFLLKD